MTLRIGTCEVGGTFYTQGEAIANILNRNKTAGDIWVIEATRASVDNAHRLDKGDIEFGFMALNWIGRAKDGTPPFDHKINLCMASPTNAGPIFFVTLADSTVKAIPDLIGKRIAVGPERSGMAQHVHAIFNVLGIAFTDFIPVYLGFAEGAEALVAGRIDAQFQCPIPNAVMTALSQRADVRVVPYAKGQIEKILSEVFFYHGITMEKGVFRGVLEDIQQVAVVNVLVTHQRVDSNSVYAVVKTLIENTEVLACMNPLFKGLGALYEPLRARGSSALEMGGVPLHPGAIRAYKEAGLIS
ncbi:MAG: TAXI family TRAP transporter solute-binding subunit [Candidatus Binatia bacterium]